MAFHGKAMQARIDQVAAMARSGVPDEAIADALGLKVRTVQGYKWRAGVIRPSPAPSAMEKPRCRKREVHDLALAGMSDREIAAATGLMFGTVRTYRMFMGIQRRKRPVPGSGGRQASVELSRQGLSDEEVAERTGLAVGTVGVYRAAAGVPKASVRAVHGGQDRRGVAGIPKASVRKPVPPPPRWPSR